MVKFIQKQQTTRIWLFSIIIGVVGLALVFIVSAATGDVAIEAEKTQGVGVLTDESASAGEYISFGRTGGGALTTDVALLETLRNTSPSLSRFSEVPESQINLSDLTQTISTFDNGPGVGGNGAFRSSCHFSHLLNDDPIVFPGQSGASHLHMFFGNTGIDANTTNESLVNNGGGSCQGNELNRTGYWMPALFDGDSNVRIPRDIVMYYKTFRPQDVVKYPQGLKMIAGTDNSRKIGWACYAGSGALSVSPQIPASCPGGVLSMAVYFPECWNGQLDSPDHKSHLKFTGERDPCPSSHPKRLVEYSLHVYWDVAGLDMSGWSLASDKHNGANFSRGESVHADWYGGWNEEVQDLWFNNCIKRVRNCSLGQTGTALQLERRGPGESFPDGVGDGNYPGARVLDVGL